MKTMRKITALLLAGTMMLAACGCAEDAAGSGTGTIPVEKPSNENTSTYALAQPVLPEMAPYPDEMSFSKPDGTYDSDGFDAAWIAWNDGVRARWEAAQNLSLIHI